VPHIQVKEWAKLALFLRTAVVCALTRRHIASALLDDHLLPVCVRVMDEVVATARAEGHDISAEPAWFEPGVTFAADRETLVTELRRVARSLEATGVQVYPSLAQDVMAGRVSELEATASDVLERATNHGLPTPTLDTVVRLLRAMISSSQP
jgi:ketopantoate reductase